MKKLGKFFEQKMLDHTFKKAGEGHKLNDDVRTMTIPSTSSSRPQSSTKEVCSEGAQLAGMAAMSRFEQPKRESKPNNAIQREAYRQIQKEESEKSARSSEDIAAKRLPAPDKCLDSFCDMTSPVSVASVFFTIPLSDERVTRSQLDEHVRECILLHLTVDPIKASALMIKTLNKNKENVQVCINTIEKYISNIIAHPDEEKYSKIRLGNKAFKERVAAIEGAQEFLQAVGFENTLLEHDGKEESFFILPENKKHTDQLKAHFDMLGSTEPIKPLLDRDIKVFYPNTNNMKFNLPQDFFNITQQEIELEQKWRTEEVEKNSVLRTRAMRETDLKKQVRRYRYALIRLRFPDGIILQGTFYARDKLSTLLQFVRECLVNDWQPFYLVTQRHQKLTEENLTLVELQLAPASMLNFAWDESIAKDVDAAQITNTSILKPAIMHLVKPL